MGTVNPFFHRGPIRAARYFHGRQSETSQVLALLANGQSISIVAPRRMGKTSLLFHVSHADVYREHGLSPERYCFVYLACEGWNHLQPTELYGLLLAETQETLAAIGHADILPTLPLPPLTYLAFRQTIQGIARHAIQLVFLLDEFESLSANPKLDADFFSGLRGLATRYGVAYVTASTEPLLALTYAQASALSSPFFNIFAQIRLRLFTLTEAQRMLMGLATPVGLTFSADVVDFLLDLAGPHPLLLQIAAYHAVESMTHTGPALDETSRSAVRQRFLAEAEAHWLYSWNSLAPADQKALALLPITARADPAAVRCLEDAGLVTRRYDEINYLSPTFQQFVAQQNPHGLMQAPPLTLDPVQRTALQRGQMLKLPPTEFDLLVLLMTRAGQVFSFSDMAAALWPDEAQVDNTERARDVLRNLRKLLEADADCIQNVRGQGYFFRRLN